jgi:predicted anti-sigma-YlaC factor YlaD
MRTRVLPAALAAVALFLPGCSVKRIAINSLGNALAGSGDGYATDDDPDLIGDAAPFGLKTIESLLAEAPRHQGLLYAAASGFTKYAYPWVQQEADFVEATDLARATYLRNRARRLYKRALEYGLRGLEVDFPGFRDDLRRDPKATLARTRPKHLRLLFWTANAWGAAISVSKADSSLTADQDLAAALMARALELDERFESGSGHEFFVAYEGGRASVGGSYDRAEQHLKRVLEIAQGRRAASWVTWAENVCVGRQDRQGFEDALQKALAIDPDAAPELRLSNLLYQKRARWLLGRTDELFLE